MRRGRGKLLVSALIMASIIAIALLVLVILGRNSIKSYEQQISSLKSSIEVNQKYVYVAMDDIEAGDVIKQDGNVIKQQIASGIDAGLYITDADFIEDLVSLVDIPAGQPIMRNMLTNEDVSPGVMEVEINVATLLVDSSTNDYVDMRIAFADGSDFIVLAKKQMKNLIYNTSTWYTDLNEQEILTLTSAVTDAYSNTGTYIYLTRYTNPTIQAANQCTYPVNGIVHDIVTGSGSTQDPNINRESATYLAMTQTLNLLARQRLEDKLKMLTPEQLAAVAAGRGLQDTASATAYAAYEESLLTSGENDTYSQTTETANTNEQAQEGDVTETDANASDNSGILTDEQNAGGNGG